jgi:sodium transport system ATP-binding protein
MIDVNQLVKSFAGVQAVNNVSFTARDGEVTALLGPNGAGKTTTLRMISSLVVPDQGHVLIDGTRAHDDPQRAKERLALLTDARGLYQRLTARENIAYYGQLHGLTKARIDARIDDLATRLDAKDLLSRRTEGFSTGEKMKTAIARALIHDPKNVILDEPTNGLDVMTTRSVRSLIAQLRRDGKCVLFSSHIMQEVAALADRIVIIAGGKIAASGTPEDILATSGEKTLEEAFVRLSGLTTSEAH